MAGLTLKNIYKVYDGGIVAVKDFNLDIEDQEFIVLVGPSGCGKSTTLRMIAGLERISAGDLYIDGKVVNDITPKDRDIAMVFQNYALYPHMTVYDNMAFALKQMKMDKHEIDRRVQAAAKVLNVEQLLTRKPKSLSGGQKQRIALGRSIVREPKVFLLDEPLSNLDAKLRVQMRTEITKLHQKLKTTFIYVTHDQTEAMTMGTRIVVMKDGVIQQVDTPKTLYEVPSNVFVATFLGSPQMNLFEVRLFGKNDDLYAEFIGSDYSVKIPEQKAKQLISPKYLDGKVLMGIRPEHIQMLPLKATNGQGMLKARVNLSEVLGSETLVYASVPGKDSEVIATFKGKTHLTPGEDIWLDFDMDSIHLFDTDTKERINDLPVENIIEGKLLHEQENSYIVIGMTKIQLPPLVALSLTPQGKANQDILITIAPDKVRLHSEGNDIELVATISSIGHYSDKTGLFMKIDKCPNPLAISMKPNEDYHANQILKAYLPFEELSIYSSDKKEKLIAKYPIVNNIARVMIRHRAKTTNIRFKKGSITIPLIEEPEGAAIIEIPPSAFVSSKHEIKQRKLPTIKFFGINQDALGSHMVIYGKSDNFDNYICALTESDVSIFKSEKIKIGIDPLKIKINK